MTVTFRPAKRENVGLLIGLAGGTGSGKTKSALRLAAGLAGERPFAVIDTEAGRAQHYADEHRFDHADLSPPFRPEAYAEAIKAADQAGYPVIVVDSASHEYAGEGGLLDWQEEEFQRMGAREAVKVASWIKPKMEHKKFVSRLLQIRAHLILCFRAEEKVEIVKEGGKTVIRPKQSLTGLDGWMPVTEKSLPYELTLSCLLTADAPGVPKPIKVQQQHRAFLPLDRPITEQTGVELARWAAGGAATVPSAMDARVPKLVSELNDLADRLGRRDEITAAVAANRRTHADDPAAHAAWLEKQLEKARARVAKEKTTADRDLFSDESDPEATTSAAA